eukprot:m.230255 g.230255  ORF g.230255 m.230255 type:complete len:506 (+) comp26021_c0_seq1:272-1789(+)
MRWFAAVLGAIVTAQGPSDASDAATMLLHIAAVRNITCGPGDTGVDHAYGDLGKYTENVTTTAACCGLCEANLRCVGWVLETDTHLCFLKAVTSGAPCAVGATSPCRRPMPNRISMPNCPDGPSPAPPPPPSPPPAHWLPVHTLSQPYRNWSYFVGAFDGFVVPPHAGNFSGQTLTDTAVVFEKTVEDSLPGQYRLTYLWFNGTTGGFGYEVGLATSVDLLHWQFGRGGTNGLVFQRNNTPGAFDYGGVTLGGMLWSNASVTSPRSLQKIDGKYWALYGCYPSRAGYEAGDGGQGMAFSTDGVVWERAAGTIPIVAGATPSSPPWESRTVYQPYIVHTNATMYDFYNAAGVNRYGHAAEETGFRTIPAADFPGIDFTAKKSMWKENAASPVIASGLPDSVDSSMASDPKVYFDDAQGVWVCIYVCLGGSTGGHADICIAFSTDLVRWDKEDTPIYVAGGHPSGIDTTHAHKVSLIYDADGVGYLYYTAVGPKGRGIALLTSRNKN